ncbi:ornithine--oxo-acid transaminase [Anaerolineales bacterium HSG6]|nr:ornithine--oxo-acid transaminase [Anaerolineales bacterium HSG6]MDM8530529.1 ornithine--oxo-acid transaminase [Anaerolineales bacterium HSG25]
MNANNYIEIENQYGAHTYHPMEVVIERGDGVWVYDVEGNKYLDCLSAYSAVNQGHCHPRLVEVMTEQAKTLTLTSRAFFNTKLPLFYKKLCEVTGYEMALTMNSGAEGVETAIKVVRKWGYQTKQVTANQAEIIVCDGNFHGRTTTIISFSSEAQYKQDFGPFPAGFIRVPYGDVSALEAAITPNTVAFMVEPIQGEGGVVLPPAGYLKKAYDLCKKHNVLFVADEIQTGLGRTGKLLACEHEGIRPDVVILGKALSGGFYPVSAVVSDRNILGLFKPGDHGSTFGGNPLGAAISTKALEILKDENLIERADELGTYFQERLAEIPSPHVKEVRGKGLLIGIELNDSANGARRFCEALRDRGILCKETHATVIRFAPPLVISKDQIDWIVDHVTEVLNMP